MEICSFCRKRKVCLLKNAGIETDKLWANWKTRNKYPLFGTCCLSTQRRNSSTVLRKIPSHNMKWLRSSIQAFLWQWINTLGFKEKLIWIVTLHMRGVFTWVHMGDVAEHPIMVRNLLFLGLRQNFVSEQTGSHSTSAFIRRCMTTA